MMQLPPGFRRKRAVASPDLLARQELQESGGDQNAVSPKGASGVMQLMPGTMRDPGFGVRPYDENTPDPETENRRVGHDYMNAMLNRYGGDEEAALVAYNWGPKNADKWVAGGKTGKLPRETRDYVSNILSPSQPYRLGPPDTESSSGMQLPPGFRKKGAPEVGVSASAGASSGLSQGATGKTEVRELANDWGEVGDDVMRNVISKTIDAGTYLAGLPGDAIKAAQWADKQLGTEGAQHLDVIGSEEIREALKEKLKSSGLSATGDWSYDPKTAPGQVAGYAPLVAGGGVARGARGAAQIAGGSMLGAAGEEIGGPIGAIAGVVAGSRVGAGKVPLGKAPGVTAADRAAAEADMVMSPATAAVKRTSQEAYDTANKAGITIGGPSFMNFERSLKSDPVLNSLKLDPQLHKGLAEVLRKIENQVKPAGGSVGARMGGATNPATMTLEEFDNLRRNALKASRSADPDERRLAGHLVNRLDDYFDSSIAPQYPKGSKALKEARHNWKLYRKSEQIDTIMQVARDRAGQFSVSGNENAIRTGFRQLSMKISKDKRTRNLFTRDEIRTIQSLARGWRLRDALKNFGAVMNNTMVRGVGGIAGGAQYYSSDDPAGLILLGLGIAAGKGARGASGYLAKRKADQLSDLIRSGGKLSKPSSTQPYVSGYLTGQVTE